MLKRYAGNSYAIVAGGWQNNAALRRFMIAVYKAAKDVPIFLIVMLRVHP
jgi:hypothetical protein